MRRQPALVACTALGLAGVGCSLPGSTSGPIEVTATFSDIGDLVVDHAVQVAGVRVGSITKIELTDDYRARVTMSVKDVDLPADVIAELRQTSLLGEKFIALRPCRADPPFNDSSCSGASGELATKAEIPIERTREAPELEVIAESAVDLLGSVVISNGVAPDLQTLVETGAAGFGGRATELRAIIDDLSTISATLAAQSGDIGRILDGLDAATSDLAGGDAQLDTLLVNLVGTTDLLVRERDQLLATLTSLTRLAQTTDEVVYQPYLQTIDRQIKQLDAILTEVAQGRHEVGTLLDWLNRFILAVPTAIPYDFAQVYGWFVVCPGPEC